MSRTRAILHVTPAGLAVWYARRGLILTGPGFPPTPAGEADFCAWLREAAHLPLRLLADGGDENFDIETLPRMAGKDRKAFIQRRQAQLAQGSPFSACLALPPAADESQGSRVLFLSLTRTDLLEPWLDCLRHADAKLQDLVSPALVAPALLPKPLRRSRHVLLCLRTAEGLQLSLLQSGKAVFARRGSIPREGSWVENAVNEVRRSRQYFLGQRLIRRDETLPLALCCGRDDFELMRVQLTGEPLALHWIDAVGTDVPPLLRAAADARPPAQLAPHAARRRYTQRQHLRRLAWGAGLLAAGLLLCAGGLLLARRERIADIQTLQRASALRTQELARLRAELPALPGSLAEVEGRLDEFARLRAQAALSPHALLQAGSVFAENPGLRLTQIEWTAVDAVSDAASSTRAPGASGRGLHLVLKGDVRAVAAREGTDPLIGLPEAMRLRGAARTTLRRTPPPSPEAIAGFALEADFPGDTR
ncbi:hypothetical protein [Niveibacterium sp. SC-1]|uniref:hypothetical protein n=1 Tax=Niveibacterium sp. SC-1 TaxID=3135646 RepID=UPI00311F1B5B